MNNKAFLILPFNDLVDKNLNIIEVALLSQFAYMKKVFKELYPSNTRLAKLFNISPRTIQRALKRLEQYNYITITRENKNINTQKRIIRMTDKCNTVYKELYKNQEYNEILINNNTEKNPLLESFLND